MTTEAILAGSQLGGNQHRRRQAAAQTSNYEYEYEYEFPIAFQIYFKYSYRTGSSIVYVISLLYIRVFLRRRGRAAGGYGQIWIPDTAIRDRISASLFGDPRPFGIHSRLHPSA